MADILLTHCNHLYYDRKQVDKMQPYPPLQTILAAACLRQEGMNVALFDATLNEPEQGFRAALAEHRPRLVAICEDNFNFLTKMCLTRNRELAFSLTRAAKEECGIPVVINSSDAADRTAEYLAHGLDLAIVGELEPTLLDVGRCFLDGSGTGVSGIRGVAFSDPATGAIRRGPWREPSKDLSSYPMPAWDLVDVRAYREAWMRTHGFFSLNMASSRGCPYHCNWCAKPIWGQSYHSVQPRRTAQEMLHLKRNFGPDQIWFADDIFALSPRWTSEFAAAVTELDACVPFKMQSRCDLMTPETVAALKSAGCSEVWMGAESGSQQILDAMDKGIRVEEIYQARDNLRRHGIRACFFLQFGYPGETWPEIESTIRMVRETAPDDVGISVSYPLPGTVFYDRVVSQLGVERNWAESGDLSMMFRGTYTSEFYLALHDALHLEVDLANGKAAAADEPRLEQLWARVFELETTAVNPNALTLCTSC